MVEGTFPDHLEEGEGTEVPRHLTLLEGAALPEPSALPGGDFPERLEEEEEVAPELMAEGEAFLCRGVEVVLCGGEAGEAEDSPTSPCCIY